MRAEGAVVFFFKKQIMYSNQPHKKLSTLYLFYFLLFCFNFLKVNLCNVKRLAADVLYFTCRPNMGLSFGFSVFNFTLALVFYWWNFYI